MIDSLSMPTIMQWRYAILIAQLHFIIERVKLDSFYIRIAFYNLHLVYRQLLLRSFTCIFIVKCQVLTVVRQASLLHSHTLVM